MAMMKLLVYSPTALGKYNSQLWTYILPLLQIFSGASQCQAVLL